MLDRASHPARPCHPRLRLRARPRGDRQARRARAVEALALGAVVNFFDTLGIGSFAPTTAWLKFRAWCPTG